MKSIEEQLQDMSLVNIFQDNLINKNLIFYDTETTGIQKDFSQILQCGSILTDTDLSFLDQQNVGCAPLPWIIPQPRAMLTNKKIELFHSNVSHYQMMKDIQKKWKEWSSENSSIFITFNGHAFDEELIRRQFWWNLLEPYTTNTNGNGRLDLMLMFHNIASFFSKEIKIPLHEGGPEISYKLEHLAKEHEIDVGDAHDAIADCKFMIYLFKIIKKSIPDVFNSFLNISTKDGIKNLLHSDEFLALGEIHRRHTFKYPVVFCGSDPSRPNDIVFFDLSFEPEEILNLNFAEINKIIQSGGRDGPLKKYKINKTIPVCSHNLLNQIDHFDIGHAELQKRADLVKNNIDFQNKVSQCMEDRIMNYPEPEILESKIYSGGFPNPRDKDLMQEFHLTDDIKEKVKISRNFNDENIRLFAERIICTNSSGDIPDDIRERYDDLIIKRTHEIGPWGSLDKTILDTEKLIENVSNKEELNILRATKKKLDSMK